MKRKLLATAVACMAVLTASAQETSIKKFFRIDNYAFLTAQRYTVDFILENYTGEGYRAGAQTMCYTFVGIQTDEVIPQTQLDKLNALFTLTDKYGKEYVRFDNSEDLLENVNDYLEYSEGNNDETTIQYMHTFSLDRGGEYTVRNYIDFMDYDKSENIIVKDDPSLRIVANTVVKTGNDVSLLAFYNTGYPFDMNSLTGQEKARITLYKHLDDSKAAEVYSKQFPLNLKDEAHPLIAGIDSLAILFEKPELGAYTIRLESDWGAIETRDVGMSVQDTLRASVSLDKEAYVLPTDKKARLGIKMDYGYPHIYPAKPDIIPTIRISALLMQKADTLLCDSMKLANDTLQTKDLLYDNAWELDLTKIDQSKLDDNAAEKKLYVTIHFNGTEQYNAVIPLTIQPTATGISSVSATGEDEEAVYTLNGMRLNPKGKLPAGVYIRNGKKIVVKQ